LPTILKGTAPSELGSRVFSSHSCTQASKLLIELEEMERSGQRQINDLYRQSNTEANNVHVSNGIEGDSDGLIHQSGDSFFV
jgi:hypothetical protein